MASSSALASTQNGQPGLENTTTWSGFFADGAKWEPHWAFVPPRRPAVPQLGDGPRDPIDAFLLARLKKEGLTFSPEAPRPTLIRRATLDLTGLPPTPAEVDAFLNDARPGAYGRLVDRLLASPRFGERMAYDWLDAARRSPVYALAKKYRVALPLHPEYRTMPMVWYVPPLSPIVDLLSEQGHDAEDRDVLFGAIEALRIPIEYLAELFTAGDTAVVDGVLRKLAAMRAYMRGINLGRDPDDSIPASVGMTGETMYEMYRLMAIAKYDERYVIPKAHVEQAHDLEEMGCSLDFDDGPGMYDSGPFGEASGRPVPVAVETFQALKQRQTTDEPAGNEELRGRVNLLNWDGNGTPPGLFPPLRNDARQEGEK